MGMAYAHNIKAAGDYLIIHLLLAGRSVPYSSFYDGTDETAAALAAGLGMSPEEADWECGPLYMDLAVGALEHQGYISTTQLDEQLADGEPAYTIDLLAAGRDMLVARKWPVFRDVEL